MALARSREVVLGESLHSWSSEVPSVAECVPCAHDLGCVGGGGRAGGGLGQPRLRGAMGGGNEQRPWKVQQRRSRERLAHRLGLRGAKGTRAVPGAFKRARSGYAAGSWRRTWSGSDCARQRCDLGRNDTYGDTEGSSRWARTERAGAAQHGSRDRHLRGRQVGGIVAWHKSIAMELAMGASGTAAK